MIHLLYRILDLSNSKILHLEELRVLVINWGVSPKEAKEFFHQYALEKDTHGVDVDEFTEKLKPIWKYGIGSIWEAVVKMLVKVKFYSYKKTSSLTHMTHLNTTLHRENFDKEWAKINPMLKMKGETKPLSINHLYGMPFNEDFTEDIKLHHKQKL